MAKKLTIKAKSKSLDRVKNILSSLAGFYYLDLGDSVKVGYVERKDVSGNPESYYILSFNEDSIEIEYTETGYEEAFRRWDVVKKAIPIISQVANLYNLDVSDIIKIIDYSINDIFQSVPSNIKEELMKVEQLRAQINTLEKKLAKAEVEKTELERKLISISEEYEKISVKLRKYENMSDDMIREKLIDWIKENNGYINPIEFAKFYNLPESRVNENLDFLVKEKYVKVID